MFGKGNAQVRIYWEWKEWARDKEYTAVCI